MRKNIIIEAYRLLIGSVGDDSHSVGMALLEIAFRESGFQVKNIGIMNSLEAFFTQAKDFDAIFISCVNGHVELYLNEFPFMLRKFKDANEDPKVWYLGGNLSVCDSHDELVKKYMEMGFDFVSPKPVSCEVVRERLNRDFYRKGIKKQRVSSLYYVRDVHCSSLDSVDDLPMSDHEFYTRREQVLDSWKTGKSVRTANIKANHSMPGKNMHNKIIQTLHHGERPLVQPRTGVAHTDDEIDILLYLEEKGLDISSIQLDAASRKNMYHKAEEGVLKTTKGKTSLLNGYPIPVHGVAGVEKILQAIETPFQIRAGSPDHRLVYEIGLAGGATSIEGGFLCYLFPYDKFTSPVECLSYWKYKDKLAAMYSRKYDVTINREYFGPLTCCLLEPTIPIAINIVQAILSAKSGVTCISVGLAEQGNRSQDIASIKVLDRLTRLYLAKYGLNKCTVSTVFHQYMAAFPTDIEKARELILNSSITGALAGATRIMTKTPVESIHIPNKENNGEGLQLTHKGLRMAANYKIDQTAVQQEMTLLERQVKAIMGAIEEFGKGSQARGVLKAFEEGVMDIPFSPSNYNKSRLVTAKDCNGAIRFVNPEILPFDVDIVDFHKEKIHERMKKDRNTKTFEMLDHDLTRIWKNDYLSWPLDDHYIM
ncbi:MAG: methylaspartate mutase subunit E [bacterium]|nr:methylaspartate mutase subunit E [bacterium]